MPQKKEKKKVSNFFLLFGAAWWPRCIMSFYMAGMVCLSRPWAQQHPSLEDQEACSEAEHPPMQGLALLAAKGLFSPFLHPGTHLNFRPGFSSLPFTSG